MWSRPIRFFRGYHIFKTKILPQCINLKFLTNTNHNLWWFQWSMVFLSSMQVNSEKFVICRVKNLALLLFSLKGNTFFHSFQNCLGCIPQGEVVENHPWGRASPLFFKAYTLSVWGVCLRSLSMRRIPQITAFWAFLGSI